MQQLTEQELESIVGGPILRINPDGD